MNHANATSWLTESAERIVVQAGEVGFVVSWEENEVDFKDLILAGQQLQEDAFHSISLVLFELFDHGRKSAGAEFHAFFYTRKGRQLQNSLSKDEFWGLRQFLKESLFEPAGLRILEFDPASREYAFAKRWPHLFPNNIPGVLIHIGGWLDRN